MLLCYIFLKLAKIPFMVNTNTLKQSLAGVLEKTRENLASIRTGRASSALVENIMVTTYGGQATLKVIELATITNGAPQELLIIPFDPSVTQDLEKALRESSLGLSVSVSGNQIRAKNPPLSEEQRVKYTKLVSQYAEEGREIMRRQRDEIRKTVKAEFEAKTLSEDQKYRMEEDIDKITKEYTGKIDELRTNKEKEVMTV